MSADQQLSLNRLGEKASAALTALAILAVVFSPVAKSPSLWILLTVFLGLLVSKRRATVDALKRLWPVVWPVLAALTCSVLWSQYAWQHGTAYRDVLKAWLAAAGLLVLWSPQNNTEHLRDWLSSVCLSLGALCLYFFWQAGAGQTVIVWLNTLENMNLWGAAFSLLMGVALALALSSPRPLSLALVAATAIGYGWLALYYPSRGGLLATALCAVLLVSVCYRLAPRWLLIAGLGLVVVLGSVAVLIAEATGFMSIERINALTAGRYPIYATAWQQWLEAPWFGWGVKGIKLHAIPLFSAQVPGLTALHNVVLEMLYSVGIVGTGLMLYAIARLLWRALGMAAGKDSRLAGLLAVSLCGTLLLHGVTDLSIYRPYFWLVIFSAWGLVVAADAPSRMRSSD